MLIPVVEAVAEGLLLIERLPEKPTLTSLLSLCECMSFDCIFLGDAGVQPPLSEHISKRNEKGKGGSRKVPRNCLRSSEAVRLKVLTVAEKGEEEGA